MEAARVLFVGGFLKLLPTVDWIRYGRDNSARMAAFYAQEGTFEGDLVLKTFRAIIENRQKQLGEYHEETLSAMDCCALVLYKRKNYDEALLMSQKCVELCNKELGEEHAVTKYAKETLDAIVKATVSDLMDAGLV